LIVDDLMKVKWPQGMNRKDALFEMIKDSVQGLLSSRQLEDFFLRLNDESLTTAIEVMHRHAVLCRDMLKMLSNWNSYNPDEFQAAVEDFDLRFEFATVELRTYLPEYTSEAHDEGLSPLFHDLIRRHLSLIHDCVASCDALAREWFDITSY
jgi:hypothetical protein